MFEKGNTIGFQKGQSGNPGGRAKDIYGIRELARQHGPSTIKTLIAIKDDEKAPANAPVAAAQALLDRGYGKAEQHVSTETVQRNVVRVPTTLSTDEWMKAAEEWRADAAHPCVRAATRSTDAAPAPDHTPHRASASRAALSIAVVAADLALATRGA